jgi:arabinose-5-phosphate isomerase
LLGIFTDGDLRRSLQKYGAMVLHKPLSELMNPSPRSIDSKYLAFDAMKYMEADQKRPITVLPVVDAEEKVVGIIKMHDIVQSGI